MKLDTNMRALMSACYHLDNLKAYEFCMDKRDGVFKCRIFLKESSYFLIKVTPGDDQILLMEYKYYKSYYNPSASVTFINKYFKKYRISKYRYRCSIDMPTLLLKLKKINTNIHDIDSTYTRDNYYPWKDVRRVTCEY